MSFLRLYTSSKLECQKIGYFNKWKNSVLWQEGNYIPAWSYETDDTVTAVYLQSLNRTHLENGTITVLESENITTDGYTTSFENELTYADKQLETLTDDIYRLYIDTDGTDLYSEIFKKAN